MTPSDSSIPLTLTRIPQPTERPNVLTSALYRVELAKARLQEEQISVLLNPKPKWLPGLVWRYLLRLMLTREVRVRHG